MAEHNLLVVSDLHLSAGWDEQTGKTSRLEDFFRDDAFARFLRYHEQIKDQPRFGGRSWLLILNGDLFDFLQVVSLPEDGPTLKRIKGVEHRSQLRADERAYGLGTSARESAWKLVQIARGHQRFFAALGWFVAHGNQVAVVRGNHDVDLHWEAVQACFVMETHQAYTRQRSTEAMGPPISLVDCQQRIHFVPWFYHKAERVYVEHGGQYDAANHFHDVLNPVLANDPQRIELPWGSLFVRYLFNKVEDVHPFADNVKPLTRYLSWAFRSDPIRATEILFGRGWVFLQAFWKAGRKAAAAALHAPHGDVSNHDEKGSLPPQVTKEINRLAHWRVESSWQRWVGVLLQALISLLAFLIIGAFIALAVVTLALNNGPQWMAGVYIGTAIVAAFLGRGLQRGFSRIGEQSYLLEVGRELERILEPVGGVRYIVMGHDHRPAVERLDDAWYVNTGAWVPLYEKEGPMEGREALTFFRLAWDYAGTPELLRWDDAGGAPTRIVLPSHHLRGQPRG
jgi:UDP-2,3-diacylglucosamine pyrophosphatase LpxH